jgi:hypothetical protein
MQLMKFLRAVRLDASDSLVYSQEGAARDGEWTVSGGYAVCDPTGSSHRTPKCHCLTSFVGVEIHQSSVASSSTSGGGRRR